MDLRNTIFNSARCWKLASRKHHDIACSLSIIIKLLHLGPFPDWLSLSHRSVLSYYFQLRHTRLLDCKLARLLVQPAKQLGSQINTPLTATHALNV